MCADKNDAGAGTYYNDPVTNTVDPHINHQESHGYGGNHERNRTYSDYCFSLLPRYVFQIFTY